MPPTCFLICFSLRYASESARSGTGRRSMDPASYDAQLRQAAFSQVDRLAALRGGVLDFADLAGGFDFGGERIQLINPQRGIFKPRHMEHLLSIKTVFPRRGARVWYDDQRDAHRQIYAGDDVVDYQFMGTDPNSPDNRGLRDAMEQQIPVIYFLGTSPGRYQPIIPTFIVGWHPEGLRVQLAFGALVGASAQAVPPDAPERRYALREVKARLHQASFRDAVLAAYGGGARFPICLSRGCISEWSYLMPRSSSSSLVTVENSHHGAT
jgi:putative restriction endonuclease